MLCKLIFLSVESRKTAELQLPLVEGKLSNVGRTLLPSILKITHQSFTLGNCIF